jgi:transcription termination factor Rho
MAARKTASPRPRSKKTVAPESVETPETVEIAAPEPVAPPAVEAEASPATPPPAAEAAPVTQEKKRPDQPPVPERVDYNEFQKKSLIELYDLGASLGLRVGGTRSKHQIIFEIASYYCRRGTIVEMDGVIEIVKGELGVLRNPKLHYLPLPDDVVVPVPAMRKFMIRQSQRATARLRAPRDHKERYLMVDELLTIEGIPVADWTSPVHFDKLTAMFPNQRIVLENHKSKSVSSRCVDIISPLGKGQRGLICAPPRGGKTILLKEIAQSIQENHKEIELMIMLLDERPEEVTDFHEMMAPSPNLHITASTFDEPPERHQQVCEIVFERARRLVELKKDVVILLDSLTRLTRGLNNCVKGKAPLGSGGIDGRAMAAARKFFGAARNVEEGGSLTILATALIETDNKLDMVIFEEFKGTGNMEINLDQELVERRIFPAINITKTGTRRDDLLYHPEEFRRIGAIRKQLISMPAGEAMETLTKSLKMTQNNAELLLTGLRT